MTRLQERMENMAGDMEAMLKVMEQMTEQLQAGK